MSPNDVLESCHFSESVVEDAALAWLAELGWQVKHGPEIAPGVAAGNGAI